MKFNISNGPHIKSDDSTKKVMSRLLIVLVPIVAFGIFKNTIMVYYYTNATLIELLNPILMIITGILTSLLSEYLYIRFIEKNNNKLTITSLFKSYAIIPGLFLSLLLPVNTPIWIVAFGAFCATILGKMIFGGLGQNIFNPALVGYLIIGASYSSKLGSFFNKYELDAIGGATPLTNLSNLKYIGSYDSIVGTYGNLFNFFSGTIPGVIGEASKILIIIAFIYLAITKTIKWKIPVFYILTVFGLTFFIGNSFDLGIWYPLFHILSGGLLFGAVFMATDPVTSPITNIGQIFYGITLGILTVLIRFLTSYPEGVMTSILFMNLLVFLYDKFGIKLKYNIKRIYIPILITILLLFSTYFVIYNKLSNKDSSSTTEILNVKEDGNNTIYTVKAKGWSLITADVTVSNKKIIEISVTDSSGETKWSEIEDYKYIDKLIDNQDDINSLDAVSGCTKSSNGLKDIVNAVLNEVK